LRPDIVHTWDAVPGLFGPIASHTGRAILFAGTKQTDKIVDPTCPRIIAGQYRIHRGMPAWDQFVHRCFAKYVDHFIASSAAVRDWYVERGLPGEKFTLILSGVPPARPSDVSRGELLHELKLPPGARLIGVVGRLTHEKRVKDLIWAADLLRVLHDNLRLLIIGDGPQCEQLVRYARLASDLEHIQFLGPRDDVWRIMPHLDVLWNGSENRGPTMAILEAMAAGVPVVASETASNRELVVENETGYLIPLGSRAGRAARARVTDRIFSDATLARHLATAARKRAAEHFGIAPFLTGFRLLYDEAH
jgi:glycosyltransferase involved in cell wall biosynthesis